MSIDFERRTEKIPSITYPDGMPLDPHPIESCTGRLLPGSVRASEEFEALQALAKMPLIDPEALFSLRSMMRLPTVAQLERITINPDTGCWELDVYIDLNNLARYGRMSMPKMPGVPEISTLLAHRTMFFILYGSKSVGSKQFLDHLCCNKRCCWPRHLEPVSPGENTRRGRANYVPGQNEFNFEL